LSLLKQSSHNKDFELLGFFNQKMFDWKKKFNLFKIKKKIFVFLLIRNYTDL
jgi:hypothetical protein